VASNHKVAYYDGGLDELTYLDADQLPLTFLLNNTVRLRHHQQYTFSINDTSNEVQLTVYTVSDRAAPVTFVFAKKPTMTLLYWYYTSTNGTRVTVHITNLVTNIDINPQVFVFRNPRYVPDSRRNKR
jgi:outer membrane lipoprotein-sorting protein